MTRRLAAIGGLLLLFVVGTPPRSLMALAGCGPLTKAPAAASVMPCHGMAVASDSSGPTWRVTADAGPRGCAMDHVGIRAADAMQPELISTATVLASVAAAVADLSIATDVAPFAQAPPADGAAPPLYLLTQHLLL